MRVDAHGEQVSEGMVGRDTSEQVRVIDETAKMIDRLHQLQPGRHPNQGCVVGMLETRATGGRVATAYLG